AEDDKKIAMALTVRLKSLGFSVVTAHDVPTALIVARKHDPDLALVDIGLPGGDGFRVADCLRTQVCARDVPIIFITARNTEALRQLATTHGASGLLEKPFKASDLVAKIDSALLKMNRWQEPRV